MEKEIENSLSFWNDAYKEEKPEVLQDKDYKLPKEMESIFETFLDKCPVIMDFGCGAGEMLYVSAHSKKSEKLYGIEKGSNIINFLNEMISVNHFDNDIEVIDGGIDALKQFKNNSVDGIIISNVLDVVTEDVADNIMKNLLRVLKKGGFMLLKLNQYETKEQLDKDGRFINFKDNMYSYQGVMRIRECTTDEWRKWLSPYFKEEMYADVPYQAPTFFDRLFLLRKK